MTVRTQACGYPATTPDPLNIPAIEAAAAAMASNNSYARYGISFDPTIDVAIECVPVYQAMSSGNAHDLGMIVMADVVQEALDQGVDLQANYDLIGVYTSFELKGGAPAAVGRFAWMSSNRALGAGMFHEWGHAFKAAHSGVIPWKAGLAGCGGGRMTPCYPNTCVVDTSALCDEVEAVLRIDASMTPKTFVICPPPADALDGFCVYGDMYDYMGVQAEAFGSSPLLPRVDSCYIDPLSCGSSQPPYFASEGEMHVHPIRKLQQGWLDDANVAVVAESTQGLDVAYTLARYDEDLVDPPGVHAIEIPRRIVTVRKNSQCFGNVFVDVAESYWVWWRGHEPMLAGGVCVGTGTKSATSFGPRTLEFDGDVPFPVALDHEDLTLDEGEVFYDPTHRGGITIKCQPGATSTRIVTVSTNAVADNTSHIPQVSVTVTPNPKYAGQKNPLLGDPGDFITIHAEAVDPAIGCVAGAGIESLVVEVVIGEGGLQGGCLAQFPNGPPPPGPGPIDAVLYVDPDGGPTWPPLLDRKTPGATPTTIRSVVVVRATATTTPVPPSGRKYVNQAETIFYLNQRQNLGQ
ncbi:MAG: hypothetical protein AAF628_17065 [Planctomycetota bacterium]